MKLSYLLFSAFVIVMASCSNDAEKFGGTWQSVMDSSKQITFTGAGDNYTFETRNIDSAIDGATGTYNKKEGRLEFPTEEGGIIYFEFDAADHLLGFGQTFEKANPVAEDAAASSENSVPGEEEAESESEPAKNTDSPVTPSSACGKGNMLVITGNNVRVRNEPDLTKQNILFQVHKNFEVVHLDDKTVDGQKWYKVCYDGNIGWVSGQYAVKK